ncbi:MAG: Zn-ribbon domain-containing OB-fold protein [Rhodospirillales bacterium]|nr:Zn-ribbon domain-containing OB-fold protein [Rhodospirillales bacterium]
MSHLNKPVPAPDPDTKPFWDGCRKHELLIQECDACGRFHFPPAGRCPHCGATGSRWVKASGKGTVYSWIVVVHPVPKEVYAGEVPYVVALVDLEEGVRMATNIVGCDPHAVTANMPVEVSFQDVADDLTLPCFRPAKPSA